MDNPGFYAILPASVRYDNRLKAAEKILFCEITALSDQNGYCHAQNGYFSQLYQVDERTIRRWIHQLERLGYIRIEYEKAGDTQQRRIIPGGMPVQNGHTVSAPDKNVRPPRTEMSGTPGQNCPPEQYKYNNTRYSNIRGRAREEKSPEDVFSEYASGKTSLLNTLADFTRYRDGKKKPLSTEGASRVCKRLDALAKDAGVHDADGYKVAVLDQSMLNNWDGLFPLKYEFEDRQPIIHAESGGPAPAPREIRPDEDISKYF